MSDTPSTTPIETLALSVICSAPDTEAEARAVAERLHTALIEDCRPPPAGYVLELGDRGWELHTPPELGLGTLKLDFAQGPTAWRLRQAGRRQPLGRALGLKPGTDTHVIDATAGLGRDGMVLANLGCRVTLIERSPIVALLLRDALQRTAPPDLRERVQVEEADARRYLLSLTTPPDAVYLDPMYPERGKSALVKKEMRILRELVGKDPDAAELLDAALACGARRVAVKRPRGAPIVDGPAPSHSIEAPNTRYDVYLCPANHGPRLV
jgi:16S rRNA (guanine1516-N2)-methyltransferase